MINMLFRRIRPAFASWRLLLGRDPRRAPPFSIVLFPLRPSVLFCGIGGILAVKSGPRSPATDAGANLARCFAEIRKAPLSRLIAGKIKPDGYLGGAGPLAEMERDLTLLRQEPHFEALFFRPARAAAIHSLVSGMAAFLAGEEALLEAEAGRFATAEMEIITGRLILLNDILWGLEKDILANIGKVLHLAGASEPGQLTPESFAQYGRVNLLLNCIDRLEVRGRDSAGLQVSLTLRNRETLERVVEDLKEQGLHEDFRRRSVERDLLNGSIHVADHVHPDGGVWLSFVYKTASIIGKLGENVRKLRETVREDRIFRAFARQATNSESTFAHTRWASVGSITEENCHPIDSFTRCAPGGQIPPAGLCAIPAPVAEKFADALEPGMKFYPAYGPGRWTVSVVLNGDIDNHRMLRTLLESAFGYEIAPEITSDTKIIPLQVERYLLAGMALEEAFRLAVNDFEGSHAIALVSNVEPGKIFLALKGSGQALFVGLREDQYLFASELYGLVEGTSRFIRMDGEKPRDPDNPGSSGQIFVLDQRSAGGLSGIRALTYDGHPVGLTESMVQRAEITTRDIDRGAFPHFFLKEITESAQSVRKTLRGKYRIAVKKDGARKVRFNLGADILPADFVKRLRAKKIRRVYVIGQGTAAIAGQAVADGLALYLAGAPVAVQCRKASEMSGFLLREDLSDTLVIAVTQSGTTTDTNRAVAMAAERGATILSIVNRRQSDITAKSHGVFYTSDGRDIEMSVASTKAFYSQIVAGYVLALAFAQILRTRPDEFIAAELATLETAPGLMRQVLERKDEIRQSAEGLARFKKYWAVVGSGPNKASADEIRIKLSELCYKTISSDVIEDKKHIDLSSEPLILVCAAGNPGTVAGDVVKDTAIFKAHKASVVVFAEEGETRFDRIADSVIRIPRAPMPLPVILNTLAGHLWGYYAASAIDDDAAFFRGFRNALNLAVVEQDRKNFTLYQRILDRNLHRVLKDFTGQFTERKNRGALTQMSARTMTDISLLTKYVAGRLPLEDFWADFGEEGEHASPVDLLNIALGHAIDEMSRPIDAIRHQAKTVTVGTSRKEEMPHGALFDLLATLRFTSKNLKAENILALDRIRKAVAGVRGYTLYEIADLDPEGHPTDGTTLSIVGRGGVSAGMPSRTETSRALMGTKRTLVRTGNLYVGTGRADGSPIVIIPLLRGDAGVSGLLLVHVEFNRTLSPADKMEVLGDRYRDLRNLVNEYNIAWSDRDLEPFPLEALFGEPIETLADQIRMKRNAQRTSPACE
ncbi:MAG TPA: SIS domain-containing protein [Syntrophales bacterium]|nr:SIS domain-containing protein [Syntrophales bacterium]